MAPIEDCLIDSEKKSGFHSKDSRILQGSKAGQLCSLSVSDKWIGEGKSVMGWRPEERVVKRTASSN